MLVKAVNLHIHVFRNFPYAGDRSQFFPNIIRLCEVLNYFWYTACPTSRGFSHKSAFSPIFDRSIHTDMKCLHRVPFIHPYSKDSMGPRLLSCFLAQY